MRNAILSCVKYRKLHCQIVNQNMSNLPEDYVETSPPFTYCALDYFGPFMIKRHMELKCYKLLFRRASRAINVKTASFLKGTDSFIHPLHFHRHQRPMRQLRKDQGTNFIEECRELKEALQEMNHNHMRIEPLKQECHWTNLKRTHQEQATWVAFGNNR